MNGVVKFENVSKSFSGVCVLSNINLEIKRGEVHAICGENGAGKSTLIKILAGVHKPDLGSKVIVDGEEMTTFSPIYSRNMGISVIYQELDLIPYLTTVENIVLGNEPRLKIRSFINKEKSIKIVNKLFEQIKVKVPLFVPIRNLSIAHQQMIMIARAISYNAKVLVMDEPTATLVDKDVENLFKIVKDLKNQGITIIYISHRIEEIFRIADRVTVLRDGQKIITHNLQQDIKKEDIISYIIGRKITLDKHAKKPPNKDIKVLEVMNVCTNNKVENVSFDLYEGEILGIAGLVGSGRTELARAIFGADKLVSGKIKLYGKEIEPSPYKALKYELGYVPEDRKAQGLFLNLLVIENISIITLNTLFTRYGFLKKKKEKEAVNKIIKRLDIRPPNCIAPVKRLSGGNQQKVALAKWLLSNSKIFIIDEPTRGIDVGAKEEIYKLLYYLKSKGHSIIMISSELPEIIRISDRVAVMSGGKITGFIPGNELSEEKVMKLAI